MKIFPLLLVFCAVLILTACSKDEPVATSTPAAQTMEKVAPAATAAVEQAKQVATQVTENATQVAKQVENTALAAIDQGKAALSSGQAIYTQACMSCHKMGIIGAPKVGDKAAWTALIASGADKMANNAIKGIGSMPAKGGVSSLSDEEVTAAVDYMVEQSR